MRKFQQAVFSLTAPLGEIGNRYVSRQGRSGDKVWRGSLRPCGGKVWETGMDPLQVVVQDNGSRA